MGRECVDEGLLVLPSAFGYREGIQNMLYDAHFCGGFYILSLVR
jgi:hypothetical protein